MQFKTLILTLACCVPACMPSGLPAQSSSSRDVGEYVLGPEDVVTVRVQDIDEYSTQNLAAIRVDPEGDIRLPLVGRMNVGGLSVEQVEKKVANGLKGVMHNPEVTVAVTEFGSRPVSVLGAVKNPGVHQISGRKTLFEVLSLAGGLSPDAGNAIEITRRVDAGPLPLAGAAYDRSGKFLVGKLDVRAVMEAKDPGVNIDVLPNDVITVPKAELVYVIGAVKRPGGFVLSEKEQMSALQALSLAEGLDSVAASKSARILRQGDGEGARAEIPINVSRILDGSAPDVALHANDILFVPTSKAKSTTMRAMEVAIQMGTGLVIFR
jgi:polysaccharide biosynthesis/export protein